MMLLFLHSCRDNGSGDNPVAGETVLQLKTPSGVDFDWKAAPNALVNGTYCKVTLSEGSPVIGVDASSSGEYEIIFPAEAYSRARKCFVLPPAQIPSASGAADPRFFPMHARTDASGEVYLEPLVGIVKINVKRAGRLMSAYLSAPSLSGTFDFDGKSLSADSSYPLCPFTVVNAAGNGSGLETSGLYAAVPPGNYSDGITVRVTDNNHHVGYASVGAREIKAGDVVEVNVDFAASEDILFAEHFDNCAWGGDCLEGNGGYGPSSGTTTVCDAACTGTEHAYFPKDPGAAGTPFFELTDWNTAPSGSSSLQVSKTLLANMGLLDWSKLFYVRAYQGYIGCDPSLSYSNRPIVFFPPMKFHPSKCDVSLRFRAEKGCGTDFGMQAFQSVLESLTVDDNPMDVDLSTSTIVSHAASMFHPVVNVPSAMVSDGEWHTLTFRYAAFGSDANFRITPTMVRNVKNCFWIDDIVVREVSCEGSDFVKNCKMVSPVTQKGNPSEDVSNIRLQPSFCTSINNSSIYSVCPSFGMDWMCGGLPSDESQWKSHVAEALSYRETYGPAAKIWCSHLPYGTRGATRNRDLCVPDEALRRQSVEFFKRAIRAIAPMRPANVLVHCNQTLLFNDGSSVESLVKSLAEIAPVADSIGAHLVVENMAYGVGADARELSDAIDRANALAKPKLDIRICMDTGHANLYLHTVTGKGTIVDWLITAGTRVGHLHIAGNRGKANVVRPGSITAYDDHLFPGYEGYMSGMYDLIWRDNLWGEFYRVLLKDCLYRGPFNYEVSSYDPFATVAGDKRYDHICAAWTVLDNYDNYIYPQYRKQK